MLRTALGLGLVTGTPFRIANIRAGRTKPGLLRQHLAAVRAAAEIGDADVDGDTLGSTELVFRPRALRPGSHSFSIGSAGSATLVLQTVLPALLCASGPSDVAVEGGTHNPLAPPFEFLAHAFAPLLARMGASVELRLVRHGFFPAGGGRIEARVSPAKLTPLELFDRGALVARRARALASSLPAGVATREIAVVRAELGLSEDEARPESVRAAGPGNAVWIALEHDHVTEVFVAFGERGVPAERVASLVCQEARAYLASDVPVGAHLADQLLVPLALAGSGAFRTVEPTGHTRSQIELIPMFLDVAIGVSRDATGAYLVEVGGRGAAAWSRAKM